ncbi:hypothetical protein A4X20_01655 [Mycolicibacterium iranicum]|uniref:ANTAR domain-containing protein n=1 Tax=Mycolicibacterium iranicum TaxID=912594 RepID=A0A178M5C8_MYCIR|nr:hypothetical protein A4X20_01655 [Mycolicibacterium iranicum]
MYSVSHPDPLVRRNIDIAIGIIVGRRRCSEDQAFREIASVAHKTGCPLGETADALIAFARVDQPHARCADRTWADLF